MTRSTVSDRRLTGDEDEPDPMSDRHATTTDDEREAAVAAAALAVQQGRLVVLPTDTVYGIGADAFDPDAVKALLEAKGRGPGDAAARADQRGHHPRRDRDRRARLRPRAGRRVLAGPAHAGLHPAVLAAVGPRRHPRHGRGPDARPRRRPRAARADRTARGQLGQPHRPAGRDRRRPGRGDARRRGRRDRGRGGGPGQGGVDHRRRHRLARAACCAAERSPSTTSTPCSSRSAPP